jgi:thiamine biosynthesis lipoprotein
VPVSELVFEAIRFALHVAEISGGAFDPVVGGAMIARGFNRHYISGEPIAAAHDIDSGATFRDVSIDETARTVTLRRPITLDLGGVAKGLAIDLAAKELEPVRNFSIDAGGDLYLGGKNDDEEDWSVGIRHPRKDHKVIEVVRVSDKAVCTSGDYERGAHLLDPQDGSQATGVASATVIAPTAMLADAASTAAFVMGPVHGVAFCRRIGVAAILFTPDLERHASHE